MKKYIAPQIILLAGLGLAVPARATGFVTLPARGLAVSDGRSAYAVCNVTGQFGSDPGGSIPPTPAANNTCAIFRDSDKAPPLAGYALQEAVIRDITLTHAQTFDSPVVIGKVTDQVWRKGTRCIYAAKIRLNNVDYDLRSPGPQYFEINDFVRGGFRQRGPVSIAYHFSRSLQASDEVLYRAGLTDVSVVNQPGDPAQPLTDIAPLNTQWVTFTTDLNYFDPDGSSVRDSSWFFVQSRCTAAKPVAVANALRFRQMGQEDQPALEVSIPGFAPANARLAP
jgi:hypothetical protein